jgi:hypothetical protein
MRASLVRGAPGLCFVLEISRNGEFETYEFERFGGWFDGDVFMLLVSSAPNLS